MNLYRIIPNFLFFFKSSNCWVNKLCEKLSAQVTSKLTIPHFYYLLFIITGTKVLIHHFPLLYILSTQIKGWIMKLYKTPEPCLSVIALYVHQLMKGSNVNIDQSVVQRIQMPVWRNHSIGGLEPHIYDKGGWGTGDKGKWHDFFFMIKSEKNNFSHIHL